METIETLTERGPGSPSSISGRSGVARVARWGRSSSARRGLRPEYRFAKVNVDEEPELAARFGITSIPTLVVLRDGREVAAQSGVINAAQLVEALDRIAAQTPAAA